MTLSGIASSSCAWNRSRSSASSSSADRCGRSRAIVNQLSSAGCWTPALTGAARIWHSALHRGCSEVLSRSMLKVSDARPASALSVPPLTPCAAPMAVPLSRLLLFRSAKHELNERPISRRRDDVHVIAGLQQCSWLGRHQLRAANDKRNGRSIGQGEVLQRHAHHHQRGIYIEGHQLALEWLAALDGQDRLRRRRLLALESELPGQPPHAAALNHRVHHHDEEHQV